MSQLSNKSKGGFDAKNSFADELMWLNFETKMRNTIRELIQPVVEMSQRDREGMLILEGSRFWKLFHKISTVMRSLGHQCLLRRWISNLAMECWEYITPS